MRSFRPSRRSPPPWSLLGVVAGVLAVGCRFDLPARPDSGVEETPDGPSADAPAGNPTCAGYDFDYNGHRYRLVTSSTSWMQAKAGCEADGGYLLKLDTQQEDDLTAQLVSEQTEIWIGLHDADNDGTYLWTDGAPPAFTRWATPPTAGSPDCVFKNTLVSDGRWYPLACIDLRPSVCECTPQP